MGDACVGRASRDTVRDGNRDLDGVEATGDEGGWTVGNPESRTDNEGDTEKAAIA